MSRLRIFDDQNGTQPLAEHSDPGAIAEALGQEGMHLILTGRNQEALAQTSEATSSESSKETLKKSTKTKIKKN